MKVTNNLCLPDVLVRAIENDGYSRGDSDFSVTELLKPARARTLEQLHKNDIEEDASSRVWSLLGQTTHTIIERGAGPDDLVETRFFGHFDGVKVSGQIDLLSKGILSDWKVTKAYPFSTKGGSGQKPEWIQQLNMQLELLRMNGMDAEKLQIVGILRDFDQRCLDPSNKMKFMAGYPKSEIAVVDIPIWPREQTQSFIKQRVTAHQEAQTKLPNCSTAETWGGNRCKAYCSAAKFCTQYQEALKTGLLNSQKKDVG